MTSQSERYTILAPLDVNEETALAVCATYFFAPANYHDVCAAIGKSPAKNKILPMSASDFLKYLDKKGHLKTSAHRFVYHVRHLLHRMTAANVLVEISGSGEFVLMPQAYYALSERSSIQGLGVMWLAEVLGGRFVHRQVSSAVVHISGTDDQGNVRSGSGLVFDHSAILTCRHVVSEMHVDRTQRFQGREMTVDDGNIHMSQETDVAVIRVANNALTPVPGLGFLAPTIAQAIYTFGYPKIPNVRPRFPDTEDAYLIMQSGEVTNETVVASDESELFLYSAIARPGDSGGPIISEEGYVVGMSTNLTEGRYEGEDLFSPHYAGIPAHAIARAVEDMGVGVRIPYETFD